MANILIIDDDIAVREYLSTLVTRLNHTAFQASTCAEGLAQMAKPEIQIIIADIYLPDSPALSQWVDQLKEKATGRPLILITGFLTKPFELAFIKSLLAQAMKAPASAEN